MSNVIMAATAAELEPFKEFAKQCQVELVEGGVGAANMALATASAILIHRPQRIVMVGIAGSYNGQIDVLQRVVVVSDLQGDLGAWRGEVVGFEPFRRQAPIMECRHIEAVDLDILRVKGLSVNTACTPLVSRHRYSADIETMEGAAFFQAVMRHDIPFLQLRVVSNFVDSPREIWQVRQAIDALDGLIPAVRKFFM